MTRSNRKARRRELPIDQRSLDRRRRVPLLAAGAVVVVALVTIPSLRQGTSPGSPAPAASSGSPTDPYVQVGPKMAPLLAGRAATSLASWDRAAPTTPAPTRFDNSHLSGTASGIDIQDRRVVGEVLTPSFAGAPTPKNQNCGYDYNASALVSTRAIAVAIQADPGVWPGGPHTNCAHVAQLMTVTITLPQTLGRRTILDVSTGAVN